MYVAPMTRVHGILLIAAIFAGLLTGCSSSGDGYIPSIWPEEEEKASPKPRDDPGCVADQRNLVFHRKECPRVKEIPEDRKVTYDSVYAPLNIGYAPCAECQPLRGLK